MLRTTGLFQSSALTRSRVRTAYGVAIVADVLQMLLGPFGWAGADEVIDVATMVLLWRVIGFHPLFLPTFALEFIPLADMLPTWTGCVALVVTLRRRRHPDDPPPPMPGPVIDV